MSTGWKILLTVQRAQWKTYIVAAADSWWLWTVLLVVTVNQSTVACLPHPAQIIIIITHVDTKTILQLCVVCLISQVTTSDWKTSSCHCLCPHGHTQTTQSLSHTDDSLSLTHGHTQTTQSLSHTDNSLSLTHGHIQTTQSLSHTQTTQSLTLSLCTRTQMDISVSHTHTSCLCPHGHKQTTQSISHTDTHRHLKSIKIKKIKSNQKRIYIAKCSPRIQRRLVDGLSDTDKFLSVFWKRVQC